MMKKRFRPTLLLLLVVFACGAYFLFRDSDISTDEIETLLKNDPLTYTFSDTAPPRLKESLTELFGQQEWKEGIENTSDIVVSTDRTTDPEEGALNLYQIAVLAKPFSDITDTSPITSVSVSSNLDIAKPEVEISQRIISWVPEVSLETNPTSSRVKIIPLEELNPYLIILGNTPETIDSVYTPSAWTDNSYPLVFHTIISGPPDALLTIQENLLTESFLKEHHYRTSVPSDTDFVTIIKTGTTVAGGPGWELCERTRGRIDYPIDYVKSTLSSADVTIISNESSFVEGCLQSAGTTAFCGKPSYLQNLIDLGTDIISLTGNHMCDYGRSVFSDTLDLYTANGIKYFGAGKNTEEAWNPLYIDTPAGKIAFVGVNYMGPEGVLATQTSVGSAYYDETTFSTAVSEAQENADVVWVDTHLWDEYGTTPGSYQTSVSEQAVESGADIVTGVSSHELQGMTFYGTTPVFYGLGNFLFDQMWSQETRQGMVLRVGIFEGKIINISPLPTILYDYCQPRFAEGQEKSDLLQYFIDISTFPE